MKHREISKASYIKTFLSNENILPFLELRYDFNKKDKNKNINDFINYTNITKFFLGIPHKPEIVGKGAKLDSNDFLTLANKNTESYYEKTIGLFANELCIPVFYVYSDDDVNKAPDFIKFGHDKNRKIGILTTPNLSKKLKTCGLNKEDFIFLDLNSESIKSQTPNLKELFSNFECKIILLRENRTRNTYNSSIELDKNAPLFNDLSTEITNDSPLFVKNNIYGFGDYCGFKNDVSIGDIPIDSSEFYPAVALYQRSTANPYFLGIKSIKKKEDNGFDNLREFVLKRINIIDPENKTNILDFLTKEKTRDYAAWNVITQWYYIAVMSIHDSWKD